jgi:molecular chaperone DnaK (HSP70)
METLQMVFLKSVLLGQLLLEANDNLKMTKQYRHELKNQINRLDRMLESYVKNEFDVVYSSDPTMTTNIMNRIDSLIDKIKNASIDELVMIDAVIDKYNENREWFTEHGKAEFLRLT